MIAHGVKVKTGAYYKIEEWPDHIRILWRNKDEKNYRTIPDNELPLYLAINPDLDKYIEQRFKEIQPRGV